MPARQKGRRSRAARLLAWYDRQARPLPWRRDVDPYRRWVAEILLQQTRVAQATRYYERFLDAFPTVERLARAPVGRVLKRWEGAGYYARARHLHDAARRVVAAGGFPHDAAGWRELPGVGPYTAAALASLLDGEPVVALDANGLRVAARWTLERGDARAPQARARLEAALRAELPPRRAGDFNEALMELGETLCRPRAPRCSACPVGQDCRAFLELAEPGSIPVRRRVRERPHVVAAVAIVEHEGRWLVQRRAPRGLLGGLWEFPGGKLRVGEAPSDGCRRELLEETGLDLGPWEPVGTVRHDYSHFTVELHAFRHRLRIASAPAVPGTARWVSRKEFERLPRPRATSKVAALLAP